MANICHILSPKLLAQPSIEQHMSNFLQQYLIHTLFHNILLWCIINCEVLNSTILLENAKECITFILPFIVHPKLPYLPSSLVFNHIFPFKKNFEYFIISFYCIHPNTSFHCIHPNSSVKVIHKIYKVVFPSK